ncbi:VRR-NUC domain-containing protein [Ectopseudomonas khazarica]|uniref:VRR-NUC domain-containing protein n=1 Tax=Ectopseudomonas khazarica TaxID=2502979 RepID=A0ABW7M764_9GAMM
MAILQPQTQHECTTTSIEGTEKEARLPRPTNKPYLMEKANYAVRFPRLSVKNLPSGGNATVELKQLIMSGLIRADEYLRDFRWDYKAEVCFDMSRLPPAPFLSTSTTRTGKAPDPDRRHTLIPFPVGLTKGLLRRPDVIIVKNRATRWPGQAGPDHQGIMHPDNLERVVEVKFPGDKLGERQRSAYIQIAGSPNRFSVLEVHDCRDDGERERDRQTNESQQPTASSNPLSWPVIPPLVMPGSDDHPKPRPAPVPVPVYGPTPIPKPAHVESWTQQVAQAIDGLLEEGAQGIRQLSAEVQSHLEEAATWLSSKGQWMRSKTGDAWEWVSETGAKVLRWTDEQLRAIWAEVQRYTDLTLEMLGKIDWVQVLIDVGLVVGTVVVAFVIAGALVAAGVPAAIVSGLLVLVRLAQLSWAWLASILGAGAVAGALSAG